jgi:hypothetical protein
MPSWFNVYLIGFIILIIGLAMGAHLLGLSSTWIIVGVICLVGIGILSAVKKTQGGSGSSGTGGPPKY